MRVSPIALFYHRDLALALQNAVRSSHITHPYATNSEACKIYTELIVRVLGSVSKEELVSALASYTFEDPDLRLRFKKYSNLLSFQKTKEQEISSSGYVIDTLEASLWAFFTTSTFEEGALKAVNLGGDADTIGAIYGGIAGAYYGVENIPQTWISRLESHETVSKVVEGLVTLIVST